MIHPAESILAMRNTRGMIALRTVIQNGDMVHGMFTLIGSDSRFDSEGAVVIHDRPPFLIMRNTLTTWKNL